MSNAAAAPAGGPPEDAEILAMARRETCIEHCEEFEPIVKGPLFAVAVLAPLCAAAVACQAWRILRKAVSRTLSRTR
jgi:hypothetical protein